MKERYRLHHGAYDVHIREAFLHHRRMPHLHRHIHHEPRARGDAVFRPQPCPVYLRDGAAGDGLFVERLKDGVDVVDSQ